MTNVVINTSDPSHFVDSLSAKTQSEMEMEINLLDEASLYSVANFLLQERYMHCDILSYIIINLFDDTDDFISLICQFLEGPYQYCNCKYADQIIKDTVLDKLDVSFSIVKSMVNMGDEKGLSAGIILSMIYTTLPEANEFLKNGLKSENASFQRCSLVSLLNTTKDMDAKNIEYFNILKDISSNISEENNFYLIRCLQIASTLKSDVFQDVIENEIVKRGSNAAILYIQSWKNNFPKAIYILKKAIEILESENADEHWIDHGLAKIYEHDSSFVAERIRNRSHEPKRLKLMDSYLETIIKDVGNEPIIHLIEDEIDAGNTILKYTCVGLLESLFLSHEKWILWCNKWKDDKRKESCILKSLGLILTKSINDYRVNDVRENAIQLVQYFAEKNAIDYAKLTKGINFGADTTEGYENKEKTLKSLVVLKEITSPRVEIDFEQLNVHLNNAPCLCKAFGSSWLLKNAKSQNPHIINYIFSDDYIQYHSYLENAFFVLDKYGIRMKRAKLRDVDNGINILAEVEIISKLAPYFKITPEPDIDKLKPKNLDLMIEYNGEKALIEIATIEERLEVKFAHGFISIPGGKTKNVLLNKFKSQLYGGNIDVELPIIIVLNLRGFLSHDDVQNGVHGLLQFSYNMNTDTHEVVTEGSTRENNGFYDEEKTEVVTAIAAYKRNINRTDNFKGKLYRSIRPPLNKMSPEFMVRFRDAMFGSSEISEWRTLLKIQDIDEELATLFYSKGIDDIGVLANIAKNDVEIEDFDWTHILQFKHEAIRIISALSTGSIKYLQGMDETLYSTLIDEGIYLIKQLLEKETIPEGIDECRWNLLREDARRISQ
ncbi:hypothetical protein V7O66_03295 [Methanolobus sp. ZRKC3]|uniref:hypothetical protein n=1 Tax=Methanolobus sp. ZRKC3 TaxID=3125786 RepID=UPI00324D78C9